MDSEHAFSWAHDILHQTDQGPADEHPAAKADRLELRRLAIRQMNEIGTAHAFGLSHSTISARFLELCLCLRNPVYSEAGCRICQPSTRQAKR